VAARRFLLFAGHLLLLTSMGIPASCVSCTKCARAIVRAARCCDRSVRASALTYLAAR
jgi:hypothetical protein